MMTLRSFCFRSFAGFTVFTLSPLAIAREVARPRHFPLAALAFEKFEMQLGSVFNVDAGEQGTRALRLIRAERKNPSPQANPNAPDAAYESFSLVFAGNPASPLEQDSY